MFVTGGNTCRLSLHCMRRKAGIRTGAKWGGQAFLLVSGDRMYWSMRTSVGEVVMTVSGPVRFGGIEVERAKLGLTRYTALFTV